MSETFTKLFTKAEMEAIRRRSGQAAGGSAGASSPEESGDQDAGETRRETLENEKRDEAGLLRAFWAKLKRVGRTLPFAEDLLSAYYCVLDPTTPRRVRLILLGALAYFVLPTDAIPDFLPLIGFTDDAAMIAAALAQVAGAISDEHREKARAALRGERAADA